MVAIIISVASSIISGMVLFFLQRFFKILKSIDAVGKLTYANAIAIRDGKTNGEMHEAMECYSESKQEMYDYLLEQNSKK